MEDRPDAAQQAYIDNLRVTGLILKLMQPSSTAQTGLDKVEYDQRFGQYPARGILEPGVIEAYGSEKLATHATGLPIVDQAILWDIYGGADGILRHFDTLYSGCSAGIVTDKGTSIPIDWQSPMVSSMILQREITARQGLGAYPFAYNLKIINELNYGFADEVLSARPFPPLPEDDEAMLFGGGWADQDWHAADFYRLMQERGIADLSRPVLDARYENICKAMQPVLGVVFMRSLSDIAMLGERKERHARDLFGRHKETLATDNLDAAVAMLADVAAVCRRYERHSGNSQLVKTVATITLHLERVIEDVDAIKVLYAAVYTHLGYDVLGTRQAEQQDAAATVVPLSDVIALGEAPPAIPEELTANAAALRTQATDLQRPWRQTEKVRKTGGFGTMTSTLMAGYTDDAQYVHIPRMERLEAERLTDLLARVHSAAAKSPEMAVRLLRDGLAEQRALEDSLAGLRARAQEAGVGHALQYPNRPTLRDDVGWIRSEWRNFAFLILDTWPTDDRHTVVQSLRQVLFADFV